MEDIKYINLIEYLNGDDFKSISKKFLISESTVRKYLNNDYPNNEFGKEKFNQIFEFTKNLIKEKSENVLKTIESI